MKLKLRITNEERGINNTKTRVFITKAEKEGLVSYYHKWGKKMYRHNQPPRYKRNSPCIIAFFFEDQPLYTVILLQ